jgi:hypothetical protein
MQPGFICVAGIDPDSGRQIRPIVPYRPFTRDFLHQNGGPFQIGARINLGSTTYAGHAPEWEDHRIDPKNLKYLERLTANEFWFLLNKSTKTSLLAIFGRALQHNKYDHSSTAVEHTGAASLGHLALQHPFNITINQWGKLRALLHDSNTEPEISVTDFRLWRCDHQTPRLKLIAELSNRIQSVPAVLAVGLTRPFQKSPTAPALHWLQLNNIHLQDDPLGERLPSASDDEESRTFDCHSPGDPNPKPPLTKAATASSRR